jgi:hypothetical protein
MVRVENHCCGCASPAYPCLGSSCPNRRVEVHYCDNCGEELDEVHDADGKELCAACSEEQDDD